MNDIRLGDVTISAILEHQKYGMKPEDLFLGSDTETIRRHAAGMEPFLFDPETGRITLAFQSFLIRTPAKIILVDTCNGADKMTDAVSWDTQPWLDRLHQLGFTPEDIDYVLCTHLHIDHTGWNTRLEKGRWVPTFPNATYLFDRGEYAYWREISGTGIVPPRQREEVWRINCLPVTEAGQAVLVDGAYRLDEHVSIVPTPGHSPGHYCVRVQSRGLEAIVLGDLAHHKLQCCEPVWSTPFCYDPAMAAKSRRRLFCEAVDSGALLLPTHFPSPTAGRLSARGEAFQFDFVAD
ncbi:MBL fold metallo-hydrolase [Martelella sp. AMO21009]